VKRASLGVSVLLLVSVLSQSSAAQAERPSPGAQRLRNALTDLRRDPNDPTLQERYIEAFPQDYKSFLELFEPDRELYDGHEYINVLPRLAMTHERQVGKLLVALGQDAHYEADAPGYLRQALATYGSQHTKAFAGLIGSMPVRKQNQLITFLADVENPAAYPEYQGIIDHLKALGDGGLARTFEKARERRAKQPHQ